MLMHNTLFPYLPPGIGVTSTQGQSVDTRPHPARLAVSSDQQQYDIGDLAELTAKFTRLNDPTTPAIPATVSVTVKAFCPNLKGEPTEVSFKSGYAGPYAMMYTLTSDPPIQNPSDGVYVLDLPVTLAGVQYHYKWIGTGAATAAEPGSFTVRLTNP